MTFKKVADNHYVKPLINETSTEANTLIENNIWKNTKKDDERSSM